MLIRNIFTGIAEKNQSLYISRDNEVSLLTEEESKRLPSSIEVIEANYNYVLLPGLLDAHIHGYGGEDFANGEIAAIAAITRQLGEQGVAYCAATLVSLELDTLSRALATIDQYVQKQNTGTYPGATKIVAVHLEGPFISPCCKGAHDEKVLQPKITLEMFKNIISSAPHISEWKLTLAPDIQGAAEFIRQVQNLEINGRRISVKVFIGHSNASPEQISAAMHAGAAGFTHLGNANDEKIHRSRQALSISDIKSNVVSWALTHPSGAIELIIDDEHLSPQFVELVSTQRPDSIIPITDSLSPAGMPDGVYVLGSLGVIKSFGRIVLESDPNKLAGGVATLPQVLKNYHRILLGMNKSAKELAESIYQAAVTNPRKATLSEHAIQLLPDRNNFVLFDNTDGNILLHVRDGVIKYNKRYPFLQPSAYEGKLFSQQRISSGNLHDTELKQTNSFV